MKKIIDGLRYDTESSERLASWTNEFYPGDFQYCEEELYQTRKGNYFISGRGGPRSDYSQPCGSNSVCGGTEIFPLSEDQAFHWLQDHELTEELEKLFPDRIEDA